MTDEPAENSVPKTPSPALWDPSGPNVHRGDRLAASLLAFLTLSVFIQTANFDFVLLDDPGYVADNPYVASGLRPENVLWALTATWMSNWHPVTYISYMVDAELYGLNPGAFHFTNALLHAANAALLFLILLRMTNAFWASLITAALFAIHPMRVESVAWIAERKDVLSAFFALAVLYLYLEWLRRGRHWRYALMIGCFACAVASKSMVVTWPCVLLLLDYWPLRRIGPNPRTALRPLLEKLPLFAISAAGAVVAVIAASAAHGMRDLAAYSLINRLGNAVVSYARYIAKTVWPVDLAPYYPHPAEGWPLVAIVASGIFLLLTCYLAVRIRKTAPWIFVGWFWFAGMLLPVSGLFQQGDQALADRYTYLPHAGLLMAGVFTGRALLKHRSENRAVVIAATLGALVALTSLSIRQTALWRDPVTLYAHNLAVTPDNGFARQLLGNAHLFSGNPSEAEIHLARALDFNPNHADRNFKMGRALSMQGKHDEAVLYYENAIEHDPTHALAHLELGRWLVQRGAHNQAITHFAQALAVIPRFPEAHVQWAIALIELNDYTAAERHLQSALGMDPGSVTARFVFARILVATDRNGEALRELDKLLELHPDYAPARELREQIEPGAEQTGPEQESVDPRNFIQATLAF